MSAQRRYLIRDGRHEKPPNFSHALARLSDDELREELERARGLPEESHGGYRRALVAEIERRDIDPREGRR